MSIKVFYIPFRFKGLTEFLLNMSTEYSGSTDYSGILYIAPTPRKVREAQKTFHMIRRGSYIPPQMMTVKQLSKRIYSLYGDRYVIPNSLIPILISRITEKGIGFASIIAEFVSEIKQYHPSKDIETIENAINAIFYELNIPEEVSNRVREVVQIFKIYNDLLKRGYAVDEDDVMAECPELIKKNNWGKNILILDGFYELTKSEEEIIKSLINNSEIVLISINYDSLFANITNSYIEFLNNNFKFEEVFLASNLIQKDIYYYSYPGIEEEVEGIARCIKNYFISGKIRELEKVTVAFPKLHEYSNIVERVFKRYGIPYNISVSKPTHKSRPILDLLSLIESVTDDYPRLAFSRFLISPYFKNLPPEFKDWIPLLSLESGIIKGKDQWLNMIKKLLSQHSSSNIPLSQIEKGLKWLFKKLLPLENIRNEGNFKQLSNTINKILKALDFTLEDKELEEEVHKALRELSLVECLIQYISNDKKTQTGVKSNLRQFLDSFRYIMNISEMDIEDTGVQITDFFEIRGTEPEFLFLGGLKEGDLPSKPDIDYILPDSVRTKLGLVNMRRYLSLQKFLFFKSIESVENIYLSYPLMEMDKLFLPSPFLPRNREKKDMVTGIFSREEELISRGGIPLSYYICEIERVDDSLIKDRYGEDSYIKVTDIDSYRTCPRKYFIEKILCLEPLEIKEYKIEAMLLGNIVHEIMQSLLSSSFKNEEDFRVKAEEIIVNLLVNKPIENYWKNFILDSFLSIIPEIYDIESNILKEGYSFMAAEFPVEGEPIKGIKLKGKIDRIDKKAQNSKFKTQNLKANKSIELIDYKTGSTQFTGQQIRTKGANLQLFLYASLMKIKGFDVERVGLYSLKDINILWIPGKNDKKEGRTIEDYIITSLKFLEDTVFELRKGHFPAYPLNEFICWNCSERPYCPYIQKSLRDYGKIS
ncbi:MAG: PD-(D/E)XK nuclease family protein [Thermodesulfovibrionales bacterium]